MKKKEDKEELVKIGFNKWVTPEKAKPYIHPEKYSDEFKEICRLTKPRSPHILVFQFDPLNLLDDDDWFVMVSKIKRKDKTVANSFTITRKDVAGWITCAQNMEGFEKIVWAKEYEKLSIQQELFGF